MDAAASSATLWDDIRHLAAGMADIPAALRDRMPDGGTSAGVFNSAFSCVLGRLLASMHALYVVVVTSVGL